MKSHLLARFRTAAILLLMLPATANLSAGGEGWNSWMPGSKAKHEFDSQISMARLSERHGQPDTAKKIYAAVLVKEPLHQLAHHRLAVIAAKEGDFEKADLHFASAMQAATPTAELMGDMGYTLYLQNRLDEAEKTLRDTITQFPSHKAARNTLGLVLGQQGRYEEALEEFRQVVGEAEAHANLGFIMSQSGQLEQASKHYHQALKLDESMRNAAEALIQLNEHLPAQSAVFTRNGGAINKQTSGGKTPTSTLPAPQTAQPAAAGRDLSVQTSRTNGLTILDASKMISTDPNNPIPPVAQPSAPPTPQIPTQTQTSFTFGSGVFTSPTATPSAGIDNIADASKVSPEQLAKTNSEFEVTQVAASAQSNPAPSKNANYDMVAPPETPAERIHARVFDTPLPQVLVSDEQKEPNEIEPPAFTSPQAQQIAAAKAHADLLQRSSQVERHQDPSTRSNDQQFDSVNNPLANPIGTNISQTGGEFTPTTFVLGPSEASAGQPQTQISAVRNPQVVEGQNGTVSSEPQNVSNAQVWQVVLMTMGGMFGLVGIGGVIRVLLRRKPSAEGVTAAANHQRFKAYSQTAESVEASEERFNMEETFSHLESQIRDVWAGRSTSNRPQFGGSSARSYYQ